MTPEPLVLVGTGGFARETAELVRAINDAGPTWELLGHLDDDPDLEGCDVDGLPVLGPTAWFRDHDVRAVVCIGGPRNYASRAHVVRRLHLSPERYATLVHPTAVVPRSVHVGVGSVLHAQFVATGHALVGNHVAVMPATVVTHDDEISDFVTIGAGACFAGSVHIATGAYIGSGALIRESVRVGAWSLIGMGAVVTTDVPAHEVWAGVPATHRRPAHQDTSGLHGGANDQTASAV